MNTLLAEGVKWEFKAQPAVLLRLTKLIATFNKLRSGLRLWGDRHLMAILLNSLQPGGHGRQHQMAQVS